MPRRATSRDRLERLRAEKAAEGEAKKKRKSTAAKKKKKTTRSRKKEAAPPVRMKLVWNVCKLSGEIVKTYPYPQKADAEAEAERLNGQKNGGFIVRSEKVPMEEE
jgi:hypothetical protein